MNKFFILIVMGSALMLSGCGIKGPLYIPDEDKETVSCGTYPDDECDAAEGSKKDDGQQRFVRGPDDEEVYFNPLYAL